MSARPFEANAIDEVIHGRIRLGAIAYLATVGSAGFGELKDAVGATDGNLSTHLKKLEDASYIAVRKSFIGRRPHTEIRLTAAGRTAWSAWLDRIALLTTAAKGE